MAQRAQRAQQAQDEAGHGVAKRTEIFLGEFRIIVPGLAALLGFLLNATFSSTFEEMPRPERIVHLAGILANFLALVFLLIPTSYHRFTSKMEETEEFLRYAQRHFSTAFLFIALTFVLAFYIQVFRVLGSRPVAGMAALGFQALLLAVWWAVPMRRVRVQGTDGLDA